MWEFQGANDPTRLWVSLPRVLECPVLTEMVNKLCGGTGDFELLPPGVILLYHDRTNLDTVVAAMPECDEWGIMSTWVSPHSYSSNVPPSRGKSDHDSNIEELPPLEATGIAGAPHPGGAGTPLKAFFFFHRRLLLQRRAPRAL
jgi:hypothetical protein